MKNCRKCKKKLSIDQFYAHSQMLDGHLNICKYCTKKRIALHRSKNLEKIKEYDRTRWSQPQRLIATKKYRATMRAKKLLAAAKHRWCARNKHKRLAHSRLWHALKTGKIIKQDCELCGEKKAHAHHDDYSKPLDVRWLCHFHHMEFHRLRGDFRNASE